MCVPSVLSNVMYSQSCQSALWVQSIMSAYPFGSYRYTLYKTNNQRIVIQVCYSEIHIYQGWNNIANSCCFKPDTLSRSYVSMVPEFSRVFLSEKEKLTFIRIWAFEIFPSTDFNAMSFFSPWHKVPNHNDAFFRFNCYSYYAYNQWAKMVFQRCVAASKK